MARSLLEHCQPVRKVLRRERIRGTSDRLQRLLSTRAVRKPPPKHGLRSWSRRHHRGPRRVSPESGLARDDAARLLRCRRRRKHCVGTRAWPGNSKSKRARSGLASNARRVLQRCRRVHDSMHPVLYPGSSTEYCTCFRKKENGSSRAGECRRIRGGASSDQRTREPPDCERCPPTPLGSSGDDQRASACKSPPAAPPPSPTP